MQTYPTFQLVWLAGCLVLFATGQLFSAEPQFERLVQPGDFITSLAEDGAGRVWVGTEEKGVFCFDPSANTWQQHSAKDGLGDNSGYALACDRAGRIWVGHLHRGVSVFNGREWRNYDVLDGSFGERVFALACNPVNGDVWMATNAGLTRYSQLGDAWSHFTRAEGLPEDQATSLAFNSGGTLFVGMSTTGLAIARPNDDYKKWQIIAGPGPESLPTTPDGSGLPSALVNDVCITRDDVVLVATCAGLARSADGGRTWTYVRGKDMAEKVEKRFGGAPRNWKEPTETILKGLLPEDYVTSVREDSQGGIWLGFRQEGCLLIERNGRRFVSLARQDAGKPGHYIFSILPTRTSGVFLGCYLEGLHRSTQRLVGPAKAQQAELPVAKLPTTQAPPTADEISQRLEEIRKLIAVTPKRPTRMANPVAQYVGEDWRTRGDFYGVHQDRNYRYGEWLTQLCAHSSPNDAFWGRNINAVACMARTGENGTTEEALRHWVHWKNTDTVRSLKNPHQGGRRQSEWDDHGEAYPMTHEGPHVYVNVTVPAGGFYLSFYNCNKDGHAGNNRYRDFLITVKRQARTDAEFAALPILARTRMRDFWGGVYKTFAVSGPATYTIQFHDNWSFNTILAGVFVDPIVDTPESKRLYPDIHRVRVSLTPEECATINAIPPQEHLSPVGMEAVRLFALADQLRHRQPLLFALRAREVAYFTRRSTAAEYPWAIKPEMRERIQGECLHHLRLFEERDLQYSQISDHRQRLIDALMKGEQRP